MEHGEPPGLYHEKRDFSRTPEPRGEARPASGHGLYVIQKHAASHLHYDFRLELGGVLKSWAVPKGPSCDPGQKRLAQHVEDHPVEYGELEGLIPKGEYGGGTVLLWDRGHWEPEGDPNEGYRRGKLKFRLFGEKLRGGFTLVRMHGGARADERSWLLIKERDDEADEGDVVAERPESVLTGRTIEEIAADPEAAEWHSNRAEKKGATRSKGEEKAAARVKGEGKAKARVKGEGKAAARVKGEGKAKARSKGEGKATARLKVGKKAAGRGGGGALSLAVSELAGLDGARRAAMPETIEPQLATLVSKPPAGDRWLYEMKLDGYRLIAYVKDEKARLMTRRGQDWTHRFQSVSNAVAALPVTQAIIDGELTVLKADGVSDFQALQNAIRDEKQASLVYYAFDLLHLDGYDLREVGLSGRKQALESLLAGRAAGGPVRFSDHLESEGSVVFQRACELGVEGVVAKERDAPYLAGRGGSWLKIKCSHRQELVVGGFTEPSGSRLGLGALLVGYYDEAGRLVYAGKVGTGFSGNVLRELRARLEKLERRDAAFATPPRMPGAHWTKPGMVVEIRFAGWTRDDRVRQGAFMGVREDRDAKTVVRETPRPPPAAKPLRAARGEGKASVRSEKVASTKKTAPAKEVASKKKAMSTDKRLSAKKTAPVKKVAAKKGAVSTDKRSSAKKTAPMKQVASKERAMPSDELDSRKKASPKKQMVAPHEAASKTSAANIESVMAQVELSHPDKVLYPEQGITKRALAEYYGRVAPYMLPLVARRPLTLVRCPNGQGKPCFFQKHEMRGLTDDIGRVPIEEDHGKQLYLYVESAAGLVSVVQLGALELHVWGSHIETLEKPDILVFDLDPGPGVGWETVVEAARTVRTLLDALGLRSFVKTTGGKGLHVTVPVRAARDWEEVRPFAKAVATMLERADPERYVASMAKAKRDGKVFVDYLRNGRGATAVAPYSTRARPGAYVAMPVSWEELEKGALPSTFTIESVPSFLARRGDAWAEVPKLEQTITDAMMRKVGV